MEGFAVKALTIYQPWATLIMIGAKPYEFRTWDYSERFASIVGTRIVVHASARPVKPKEIADLLQRLTDDGGIGTGLKPDIAIPLLERVAAGLQRPDLLTGTKQGVEPLELPVGAGLGTATITRPRRAADLFKGTVADSDRIDQHVYAWPLQAIEPFKHAIDVRGMQGFWDFPKDLEREAGIRA